MSDLLAQLTGVDIYVIDQLLKGRVADDARIIDVGCGAGRNLVWFARHGHDIVALDPQPKALAALRKRFAERELPLDRVVTLESNIEDADLPAGSADLVICNAVLHFANDPAHFDRMLDAVWRLVAPGGILFARLASSIGIEGQVKALGDERYLLPDGSERYLVDEERLVAATERLGATLLDPIKTTVVQGLRAMTTWVVGKA